MTKKFYLEGEFFVVVATVAPVTTRIEAIISTDSNGNRQYGNANESYSYSDSHCRSCPNCYDEVRFTDSSIREIPRTRYTPFSTLER